MGPEASTANASWLPTSHTWSKRLLGLQLLLVSPKSTRPRLGRATTASAIAAAPPLLCLCHEPSSRGWLLLGQDATVRDRRRGPGDCARHRSQVRWIGSQAVALGGQRPALQDDRSLRKQQPAATGPVVALRSCRSRRAHDRIRIRAPGHRASAHRRPLDAATSIGFAARSSSSTAGRS
jgi:hypothetical protein